MNWIILIIAGLCETGFAFCLGKTKLTVGTEYWLWISGFAVLYVLSAVLLAKATQTIPIAILAMRLAERALKNQTALLKQ